MYGALYGLSSIMPAVSEERQATDFVENCRATQVECRDRGADGGALLCGVRWSRWRRATCGRC